MNCLVHGQGQLWVKSLGVNTVIVANDQASQDAMAQTLMKTVIPKEVAMRFLLSIQKLSTSFTRQILLKQSS